MPLTEEVKQKAIEILRKQDKPLRHMYRNDTLYCATGAIGEVVGVFDNPYTNKNLIGDEIVRSNTSRIQQSLYHE